MEVRIDSEFQLLIPPLTNDEFLRLEKSILAEGVRDPLTTWNGTIIDGHNRYHICEKHGIEFKTVEHKFTSRDAAKIWIIENQFGRRNLSSYDRAQLALQLEPLYAAEAKRRQVESGKFYGRGQEKVPPKLAEAKSDTRDKLSKIAGVSHGTLSKVKAIEKAAEGGDAVAIEEREALKSGERKSIHGAYVRVTGRKPPRTTSETIAKDGRRICVMCGEPIDEGDSLPSRPTVHKKCEKEYQRDWEKTKREKQKVTEDGRRICTVCGEPIDDGDYYTFAPSVHKKCRAKRMSMQRYANPDSSLLENVPTYTTESLKAELLASVKAMRTAISESIAINESMGVKLTSKQRKDLDAEVGHLIRIINKI